MIFQFTDSVTCAVFANESGQQQSYIYLGIAISGLSLLLPCVHSEEKQTNICSNLFHLANFYSQQVHVGSSAGMNSASYVVTCKRLKTGYSISKLKRKTEISNEASVYIYEH